MLTLVPIVVKQDKTFTLRMRDETESVCRIFLPKLNFTRKESRNSSLLWDRRKLGCISYLFLQLTHKVGFSCMHNTSVLRLLVNPQDKVSYNICHLPAARNNIHLKRREKEEGKQWYMMMWFSPIMFHPPCMFYAHILGIMLALQEYFFLHIKVLHWCHSCWITCPMNGKPVVLVAAPK